MKSLSVETFYPSDQYQTEGDKPVLDEDGSRVLKSGAKGYRIKPLSSLQLTEVTTEGLKKEDGLLRINFAGIKILLRYGLEEPSAIEGMCSSHHVEVAQAIFSKSSLAEAERKN